MYTCIIHVDIIIFLLHAPVRQDEERQEVNPLERMAQQLQQQQQEGEEQEREERWEGGETAQENSEVTQREDDEGTDGGEMEVCVHVQCDQCFNTHVRRSLRWVGRVP